MKAPRSHTQQGPGKAQPGPTPIQAELAAQRAALARMVEGAEVQTSRRLKRRVSQKAKASSREPSPTPEPPTRSKPKSRDRKIVLAAYKAKRGID